MNTIEATAIVDRLNEFGFNQVQYESLWTLSNHFVASKSRLLVVTAYSSIDDFYLGWLLFGQTSLPTYFVTNFENPFASSCFASNVHVITCEPTGGNTKRIVERLRNNRNFVLIMAISDAQTSMTSCGFFHVAQALQVPIVTGGFDHVRRCCSISTKRWMPPKRDITYADYQLFGDASKIFAALSTICPQKVSKHPFFDHRLYNAEYPMLDLTNVVSLNSSALSRAVAGNYVTNKEWVIVFSIAVVIVIFVLLIYLFLWNKPHKKAE